MVVLSFQFLEKQYPFQKYLLQTIQVVSLG